jgi:glycogen operon protein
MKISHGQAHPLGATLTDEGVNFAVFSRNGTRAFVCLYDPGDPAREVARHELRGRTAHVFHGFVPGVREGALYGFRVDGPYDPGNGHRFNVHKLLLDPYARALAGRVDLKGPICGYDYDGKDEDLSFDERDSANAVPRSVVTSGAYDWGEDRPPARALAESVIYELHVKGFTRRHPGVPEELRGTYLGLAHPAAVGHLRELGVTAVELLPVFAFDDDGALADKGLVNYWGYNPLGYFAPHAGYAVSREPGAAVREFKEMVKALHAAGIEVLLDVVYNHTWEGNHKGPTIEFRGLDNAAYYLPAEDPRYVMQFSGCGNCFHLRTPDTLRLVLDSLRYWASEMHVDGYRFDLVTSLGREGPTAHFDAAAGFFRAVHQDPVLSRLKLIAEPWDLGEHGYQLGHFPVLWSEWNGRFRDGLRRYWKGDDGVAAEVAGRLAGSPDIFAASGRLPSASINHVTCHDGFTLHDLVTYGQKHNEANQEENRDGADDNHSWNCGVEGETTDAAVRELRERQKRNLLVTLLLARGVPMLTAGDELGRTQRGNNNTYCLDDETNWLDWDLDDTRRALLAFTKRLVALRRQVDVVREDAFLPEGDEDGALEWYRPDGTRLGKVGHGDKDDWRRHAFAAVFPSEHGTSVLLLLNADAETRVFTIPPVAGSWTAWLDTRSAEPPPAVHRAAGSSYELLGRSAAVLLSA